jgi:1-acyl-sn-glycerol-3-phosphate acyltransferase
MIANHPGLFDILYIICAVPNIAVLVKPTLATKLPMGPLFRAVGFVVGEGTGLEVLLNLESALKAGARVFVFPEGTRSPKGGLGRFRAGAFSSRRARAYRFN